MLFITTIIFTGSSSTNFRSKADNQLSIDKSMAIYEEKVSDFTELSISDIQQKNHEEFRLYIGRKTCPYCQIFVPKLHSTGLNVGKTLYYLDLEEMDESKQELLDLLKVTSVPVLLSISPKNTEKSLTIDSKK